MNLKNSKIQDAKIDGSTLVTIEKSRDTDDFDNGNTNPSDGKQYSFVEALRILENSNGGTINLPDRRNMSVSYDKSKNSWLRDMFKIKDSLKSDKSIVFHSTRSKDEMAEIILNKEFGRQSNGGAMLGQGFYANQFLYQAQKGNYGQYILKAQLVGVKQFLILDLDIYEEFYGKHDGDVNFIKLQLDAKGLNSNGYHLTTSKSVDIALQLHRQDFSNIKKKFYGFVYTGGHDKESIVCWYPEKCVKPLEFSIDKGETWLPLKSAEDVLHEQKDINLRKHEDVRSLQRAKDIIDRYKDYSDDKLINAMESQLKRIADPAKRELRAGQFKRGIELWIPDTDKTTITF